MMLFLRGIVVSADGSLILFSILQRGLVIPVSLSGKIVRTFAKAKSEPVSQAEGASPRKTAVARPERLKLFRNSFTFSV